MQQVREDIARNQKMRPRTSRMKTMSMDGRKVKKYHKIVKSVAEYK
mgnify:CR=1 FL=1